MRTLIILRGVPGCGKSTFVEEVGLKPYTLCPDDLRLMYSGPVFMKDGGVGINQANDKKVWALLMQMLDHRMQDGHLTVVDATHVTEKSLAQYKQLATQHRYRLVCVDFSGVPLEDALERNKARADHKRVPEEVVVSMHERLMASRIPGGYNTIPDTEFMLWFPVTDLDNYERIHFIGDIQGCDRPLVEFLKDGVAEKDAYVFVGDYLDRGTGNRAVLDMVLRMSSQPNCFFLEGNHEAHLRAWANGRKSVSREFEERTRPQIEGLDASAVRTFCRSLLQAMVISFNGKKVFVTHGGLAQVPRSMLLVPTQQLTHGVGEHAFDVDGAWMANTGPDVFQVHGHRNGGDINIDHYERSFNLEGQVEFGGALRVITLSREGWTPLYIQNMADCPENPWRKKEAALKAPESFLERLRADPHIQEHAYGRILSFSQSRKVAFEGARFWNTLSTRARGLFINADTRKICARGFDKFFYFDPSQARKLAYPVDVMVKENGFLGLLGFDGDDFVCASKTSLTSDHAWWFSDTLGDTLKGVPNGRAEIMSLLKAHDCSLLFEVIDPEEDPHIIAYDNPQVILLAAVRNTETFESINVPIPDFLRAATRVATFDTVNELLAYLANAEAESLSLVRGLSLGEGAIEGFVLRDARGAMFKVKLPFYSFWKDARRAKDAIAKALENGQQINRGLDYFSNCREDALSKRLVEWMTKRPVEELRESIIALRRRFVEAEKS